MSSVLPFAPMVAFFALPSDRSSCRTVCGLETLTMR